MLLVLVRHSQGMEVIFSLIAGPFVPTAWLLSLLLFSPALKCGMGRDKGVNIFHVLYHIFADTADSHQNGIYDFPSWHDDNLAEFCDKFKKNIILFMFMSTEEIFDNTNWQVFKHFGGRVLCLRPQGTVRNVSPQRQHTFSVNWHG